MMYLEFLQIANLTSDDVTIDTYTQIIEPMYMAGSISKYDFVEMLNIKAIKTKYRNVNQVKRELVKAYGVLKEKFRYDVIHNEQRAFNELAEEFCKLKGIEYCYEDAKQWEIPLYERGCSFYAGFIAKLGTNLYARFEVQDNKLVKTVL